MTGPRQEETATGQQTKYQQKRLKNTPFESRIVVTESNIMLFRSKVHNLFLQNARAILRA